MRQRPVSILCLLALFCLLAACSPKQDKKQEFMDHWKQLSQDSQGYSPAPSDLRPEPRVIMRHTEKQEQAASRPLPTIPVTLKLHNVDVGVALRSLAAAAGVNVMLSPGVSGTVSLNVQKSPWRDVFQGLLRANGLQYRWQGNILQVLTAVEKQKEINLQTLDNQLAQQELISRQNSPLTVSVVSVRYAEAAALQQSLTKFLTAANGQGGQAAVIEVDEHSNALIIQATEQDQQRIIRLVDNLDRPRPQVHLKAYIVEATKETARELGVQWGGVWRSGSFNNGNHAWIGSGASGTGSSSVRSGRTTASAADGAADILLDCFSPLAIDEFRRVLKPGGYFLYVVPGARHLWELKQILYDAPYPNEEKETPYEGFAYTDIVPVDFPLHLERQADIQSLFRMTPYCWKTPKSGVERLETLETLDCQASFRVHIFQKL